MLTRVFLGERLRDVGAALKWLAIVVPMAATVGSLCAAFLWSLDRATELRYQHPILLFALPPAGVAVALIYRWMGRSAEGGNNLIVEQIHEPGAGVPLRMAPLILVSTIASHLFGASVGREGTAVQIGGSIASAIARAIGLEPRDVRVVLMTGIAAGFGAVFGTPIAGAVFALEVLSVGRIEYEALVPALAAAIVGDWVCHLWGIHHVLYSITFTGIQDADGNIFHVDALLLAKVAVAGLAFGLAGLLFSEASHSVGAFFKFICPVPFLRPAIGGLITIALVYALGTRAYLGLGVWSPNPADPTVLSFFGGHQDPWSWAWKIVFTVTAISTGFKGGEVTPLFFIGAALGNALAGVMGAPIDLFAGLGFVAIFAAASNTPLACTIMGIELFGSTNTVYIAVACFIAYVCSGHSGIYLSQRIAVPKRTFGQIPTDVALRQVREMSPSPFAHVIDLPMKRQKSHMLGNHEQVTTEMTFPYHVTPKEIGMVRVYMKPKDKYQKADTSRIKAAFRAKPLYRELVQQAKQAGLVNAIAHHTHYGFSNHDAVQTSGVENINLDLTMCVEIIGPRNQLEIFCRTHAEMLQGKVIVYKHLEHWHVGPRPTAISDLSDSQIAEAVELHAAKST